MFYLFTASAQKVLPQVRQHRDGVFLLIEAYLKCEYNDKFVPCLVLCSYEANKYFEVLGWWSSLALMLK